MNRALVFSEPDTNIIRRHTLAILQKLSGFEIHIVIIGTPELTGLDLIRQYPISRITLLKGQHLIDYNPDTYTAALNDFIRHKHFDIIISSFSSRTQDIFPRLSVLNKTGLLSGIRDFFFQNEKLIGIKEIYGGKCLTNIETLSAGPWFVTFKSGSTEPKHENKHYDCKIYEESITPCQSNIKLIGVEKNISRRPPLDNADIVVAGGRGLKNESRLEILEELADVLDASIGASGGAVGNDYAPKKYLIGQTGAQISPILYIACGISGAIQHLSGVRNAKQILAINPDKNAPMMRIADYAVVGKMEDVVPALTQHLKNKINNSSV